MPCSVYIQAVGRLWALDELSGVSVLLFWSWGGAQDLMPTNSLTWSHTLACGVLCFSIHPP